MMDIPLTVEALTIDARLEMTECLASAAITQEKSVTPAALAQIVTPDTDCYLSKVTVGPIPNNYGLVTYDQNQTITVS